MANRQADIHLTISIPFHAPLGISWDDMELEQQDTRYTLSQLIESLASYHTEEVERVFKAIALIRLKFPLAPLPQVVETAMIWERG